MQGHQPLIPSPLCDVANDGHVAGQHACADVQGCDHKPLNRDYEHINHEKPDDWCGQGTSRRCLGQQGQGQQLLRQCVHPNAMRPQEAAAAAW